MRRLLTLPGITFAVWLVWKVSLLVFTVQPIPSNDAYFYDGAVVNSLHGGAFVNPTVAIARPYSGTEFFSPYPPFYQLILYGWMLLFGTSAAAAVGLHVLLVAAWGGLVYVILRRLEVPLWVMHLAGGFLFAVTFHDRPDTLAHVLGTGAMLATVNWLRLTSARNSLWWSVVLLALTFGTSLQLGAIYTCVVGLAILGQSWSVKKPLPWPSLVAMGLVPFALLLIGKLGFPRWWTGFVENAQDNPSNLGWHLPEAAALLKLARSLPGFLLLLLLLIWSLPRIKAGWPKSPAPLFALLLGTATAMLVVCALGLCYLTANYIPAFASFLQPLAVGAGLAWLTRANLLAGHQAIVIGLSCLCIAVGGIRAVGMTTWGVLCARDVSYQDACRIVATELEASAASGSQTVVLSAAYLYGAAGHTNLNLIHSDYVVRPQGKATPSDVVGLTTLKPGRLLLTQFDYYRRYEAVLAQLRQEHSEVDVRINNRARVRSPDASVATRKVVQHVSWAPVIVEFGWPPAAATK